MYGTLKKFDPELYRITDKVSRMAVQQMLTTKLPQLTHIDNPNQYGIDLLSVDEHGKVVYAWEVENRLGVWKEHRKNFPFSSVNCIERKIDMMQNWVYKIGKDLQVDSNARPFYVQTRSDNKRCIIVAGAKVIAFGEYRVDWKNKYVNDGILEKVAQVPVSECRHFDM